MAIKKIATLAIIVLALALFVWTPKIQPVQALTITEIIPPSGTDMFARYWDGAAWQFSTNPMDARFGYLNAAAFKFGIGFRYEGVEIPQGAYILEATLSLWLPDLGTDLTVDTVKAYIRGEDVDDAAAFSTSGDFATRNMTTASVDWNPVPDFMRATWTTTGDIKAIVQEIVDREGWTQGNDMAFYIEDYDGRSTASTNAYRMAAGTARAGTDKITLTIVWCYPDEVYNISFIGPYQDFPSSSVYSGVVNVTVYPSQNDTYSFLLNGAGGVDTVSKQFDGKPYLVTWNITTGGNYSRVIYFTEFSQNETIYVHVPPATIPTYLYAFTINDVAGVTTAYLESQVWNTGGLKIVERQSMDMVNAVPFYMAWGTKYEMRIVCDQGTLDVGSFVAMAESNPSIVIPFGAFPVDFQGNNITVTATRSNTTYVEASITDGADEIANATVSIIHAATNGSWVTDYSTTASSFPYALQWNEADPDLDYLFRVTAYMDDGTTRSWSIPCGWLQPPDNIWGPLDNLGTFPIQPRYLIGTGIVIAAALAFSYRDLVAGAWIAWAAAGVMVAIGWLPFVYPSTVVALGLGAVIAGFITIGDWKLRERDV